MAVPLYNGEISPPEVRGSLIALQQMSIVTGIMVCRILRDIGFWMMLIAANRSRSGLITEPTISEGLVPRKARLPGESLWRSSFVCDERCEGRARTHI